VAVRTVAIKGVRSSRYLCMDEAGRLSGQVRRGGTGARRLCPGARLPPGELLAKELL